MQTPTNTQRIRAFEGSRIASASPLVQVEIFLLFVSVLAKNS